MGAIDISPSLCGCEYLFCLICDGYDFLQAFDKREKNRRNSTGNLHRSETGDVGQWDEASPLRPRMRQSMDRSSVGSASSAINPPAASRARSDEIVGKSSPFSKKDKAQDFLEDPEEGTIASKKLRNTSLEDRENDPEADREHPSPIIVFKERWKDKERRLRAKSSVGNLPGYRLLPVIVKSNDDLRQEECAGQLIFQMHQILLEGGVDCWLRPYGIIAMSPDCGIIEAIPDTVSMDVLRRRSSNYTNLKSFFESFFGEEGSRIFEIARENFIRSLGSYCIVCYLLQIKDRHNGNILLDRKGHVIHIDFGFILGLTPGGNMGFEAAPFKLTAEMVSLMGGIHSPGFHRFRDVCVKTFMELRKHHYRIVLLLEMLSVGNEHLPFFMGHPQRTVDELRQRFKPDMHDNAAIDHVHAMIDMAANNWTTTCYDRYQRCCVGVF
jgi:phosphatidylinositol 4-kinase B